MGGVAATNLAEWNGTNWFAVGGGVAGDVDALAFDSTGKLYVGGLFNTEGTNSITNIARWDRTNWSALGTGISNTVQSLAFDRNGNLYAACSNVLVWDGTSWSQVGGFPSGIHVADTLLFDPLGNLYTGGLAVIADNFANGIDKLYLNPPLM